MTALPPGEPDDDTVAPTPTRLYAIDVAGKHLRIRINLHDTRDIPKIARALQLLGHDTEQRGNELVITTPKKAK